MALAIVHYDVDRVSNKDPSGAVSWQQYHTVRNAVVEMSRHHGPTGPLGLRRILPDDQEAKLPWDSKKWDAIDSEGNCAYYVIVDQYNSTERYIYVEITKREYLHAKWLTDLAATLARFEGWGAGITNIENGYMLVFADKLLVTGRPFEGLNDFESIAKAASTCLSTRR